MLLNPRELLKRKVEASSWTMSELSRSIGRNVAYVHQYVSRGTPRHLAERDRHALAAILGLDHRLLIEPELRAENDNDREDRVEQLARALWERNGQSWWEEASPQWQDSYRGLASFAVDWMEKHPRGAPV